MINNNDVNLSDFKGAIEKCQVCLPQQILTGVACRMCLGNGFIQKCTNCKGTGRFTAPAVWDGGRSNHTSTCNYCGGSGAFPARKPVGWVDKPAAEVKVEVKVSLTGDGTAAEGLKIDPSKLPPPPSSGTSGAMLENGVVVK